MSSKKITLVSKENEKIEVSIEIINMSLLLNDLFQDNEDTSEEVPLAEIPSRYLKDIIEFCMHYNFKKEMKI